MRRIYICISNCEEGGAYEIREGKKVASMTAAIYGCGERRYAKVRSLGKLHKTIAGKVAYTLKVRPNVPVGSAGGRCKIHIRGAI